MVGMDKSDECFDFEHDELQLALDFIREALAFHDTEEDRSFGLGRNGIQQTFGELFLAEPALLNTIYRADGVVRLRHDHGLGEVYTCILEVENEVGEGHADPIRQAECDYVAICSSPTVRFNLF